MPGGNGTGPLGQVPGSGRGMRGGGQQAAQSSGSPDWLVNTVGTLVIALSSIIFRALVRKFKSAPEKETKTVDTEKDNN